MLVSPPELKLSNLKEYKSLTPSWPFPQEEYDESIGLYLKNI